MNKKRYLVMVGIVAAAVLLTILFYTMLTNHPPVITSVEANPDKVIPSGSCQIVCTATDPDGDELSYGWAASGGEITGAGATVTWKAPRSVGSYNITAIVVDGRGGGVTDYVLITVRTNSPPTINNLIADADWITPLGSLQVTCTATDLDSDELSYEWTTDGGNISGMGAVVNWTAPQEVGIYHITVVIQDGYGGSDTRTQSISAMLEQPPIIETLTITKDPYGHCYLKTYSWGYKVGKEKMYDIECVVADTGTDLSYEWLIECENSVTKIYEWPCDGGEVSGEGSMITWTAPNRAVDIRVTVTVSDSAGNMVSKNIYLQVVSCSTCTFGSCTG